jgi:hypothetical protein
LDAHRGVLRIGPRKVQDFGNRFVANEVLGFLEGGVVLLADVVSVEGLLGEEGHGVGGEKGTKNVLSEQCATLGQKSELRRIDPDLT